MSDRIRDDAPSVGRLTEPLRQALIADAAALRLGVSRNAAGATIVDAGIAHPGGLEAGRRIAEICLGGLGRVALLPGTASPWSIQVTTADPVLACLGSQYAGLSLSHGEGKQKFQALGSGPGRALCAREPLYDELGYRDRTDHCTLVLEVDREPPPEIIEKLVRDSGLPADHITLILTPTTSLAGAVQIVARVLEVALHKAHSLHFPLGDIVDGVANAPLPAPSGNFMTAMGRTNDVILFGGSVQLYVTGEVEAAEKLATTLPSSASHHYGKSFADVFKDCGYDFYKIDPMLFAPALALVTHMKSGRTFRSGGIDQPLLERALG